MTKTFIILLTLLFSLSGPAMGEYSDFWRSSNAARSIPKFDVHPRVLDQLKDKRLGDLAGKLTPDDLQRLINNPAAQRVRDVRPDNFGNINIIQDVNGKLLRITTAGDEFKIISVGPIRPNQVQNLINNGGYRPLP